jgi:hypothetical protein
MKNENISVFVGCMGVSVERMVMLRPVTHVVVEVVMAVVVVVVVKVGVDREVPISLLNLLYVMQCLLR